MEKEQVSSIVGKEDCYAQYNYTARTDSEQFYHVDFMATLTLISERFLGEDTCHELIKSFRKVER